MSNDNTSNETDDIVFDEEVNCVFCGKLFASIEKVQDHINEKHDSTETHVDVMEIKQDTIVVGKQTKLFDVNTEPVANHLVDFNNVFQCSKCDMSFVHAYASRMHFEKVHLIRKRKRSANPNGVEGIIVNPSGSDNWVCDICGRQFPTLKQAKVHKFKSHIEPVQKKKLMLHRNIIRKPNVCQRNLVKKYISENKFREILPNSKKSKINKSCTEQGQSINNDGESSCHGDQNNLDSHSLNDTGRPATNLWRAAQSNSPGNKIVLSRVYSITNQNKLNISISRNTYGRFHKRAHVCFYCQSIFLNREGYKRHLLMHRKNEFYKCVHCDSKFIRLKMLKQHQKEHLPNNSIKSINNSDPNKPSISVKLDKWKLSPRECDKAIISHTKFDPLVMKSTASQPEDDTVFQKNLKFAEKFLNNPAITLNKGSQCVCNLCQSCFYSNNSILKHLVLYHRVAIQDGSTAFATSKCETASKLNSLSNDLGADINSQTTKPILHFIHNCDHCSSQFASKKGLQRHLHSVHTNQGLDSKFDSGVDLSKKILEDNSKLICSECSMSFHDKNSLALHRDECSGWSSSSGGTGRRVKCDICRKRFRNPMTLDEHRRLHENKSCINSPYVNSESIIKNKTNSPKEKNGTEDNGLFHNITTEGYILPKPVNNAAGNKKTPGYSVSTYKKAKVPPNADGLFECDECHKTFTCRSSLSNHVKSHFNFKNKPFSCSSCHQGFMSTLTLQYHRQQLCPNINRDESNETEINKLNSIEIVQPSIYSSFDGVSQVPATNYSSVTNTTESGSLYNSNSNNITTRATSCMHCNAMFPDRSLLEDHASKEHSNHAGEVVCIICPRSFTTYMAFRVHMTKSHGGPNGTSLKSHLNAGHIHKANTSFEMIQELSSSLSRERSNLTLNTSNGKAIHSRHGCPNCDKDFSTSQALGNHKRACMPHLYKKVNL